MADVNLYSFPEGRVEGIAYLYVKKKQYDNPTPTQLAEDYMKACKEIRQFFAAHQKKEDWF